MRVLFVIHNLEIGGVQKAFVNLVRCLPLDYEISVAVLNPEGPLITRLPERVIDVPLSPALRFLGMSQAQARALSPLHWFVRSTLAILAKLFGSQTATRLCLLFQRRPLGEFDASIAFMHGSRRGALGGGGGVQEVALTKAKAPVKLSFIHADFEKAKIATEYNLQLLRRFDRIAAVSEGVRRSILGVEPSLAPKTVVVRNAIDQTCVAAQSEAQEVEMRRGAVHFLTVARLGPEKGVDRGIRAISQLRHEGFDVEYHIVGDGVLRSQVMALREKAGMNGYVHLHGAQDNPYPFFLAADALLVASHHEAAPVVIDEALFLGLPVITTSTLSASEMVGERDGIVCCNSDTGIYSGLKEFLLSPIRSRDHLRDMKFFDDRAVVQFRNAIAGSSNG